MSEWDEYAAEWDNNEDVKIYSEKAFDSLKKHLNIEGKEWENARVLDFGCGTGQLTAKIASFVKTVAAIDSSSKMIEILNQKGIKNITAQSGNLSNQLIKSNPIYSEKFHLIVSSSVCGFLPDLSAALKLLASLLKPKGTFVQWDWEASGKPGEFGLTRTQILGSYKEAGLEVVRLKPEFSLANQGNIMPVLMGMARV